MNENLAQNTEIMQHFDFHEFTDAISSMTELLDHESMLLAEMKMREIGELQNKKQELTSRLEVQQDFLNKNPNMFKTLSNQQVDQVREYSKRFNSAMKSYSQELYKTSKVNETIVGMIVDTVKEQVRSKNTYTNFQMSGATKGEEYMPAMKFNEQI